MKTTTEMELKSIKDISWQVSEPEYRADHALSYSTLARYEREGFNNLDKLFERQESPSLTFGSAVDTLMTGSEEEFNKQFMVAELTAPPSDTLALIAKRLFDTFKYEFHSINDIPDDVCIETIKDIQWNNHWLPKTRAKKIKEDCEGYYSLLYLAGNKTIISNSTYNDVLTTVDRLKSSDSTRLYFEPNNMFDRSIERFYQLKFKATFNEVDYRCMADEIIVFHNRKTVVPVDLKTSSKPEWDFYKSFAEWRYDIQARLYWRIIRHNMDQDPYFKNFVLADYKFIVANRRTLVPLVWSFEDTTTKGELKYGQNDKLRMRDPFKIGEELNAYLKDRPQVPNGIDLIKPNSLTTMLAKI